MTTAIESSAGVKLARFGLTERDVERLVEALGNKNQQARHVVRGALRGLGEAAAPALYRGLTSENGTIRKEVTALLDAIERTSCGGGESLSVRRRFTPENETVVFEG